MYTFIVLFKTNFLVKIIKYLRRIYRRHWTVRVFESRDRPFDLIICQLDPRHEDHLIIAPLPPIISVDKVFFRVDLHHSLSDYTNFFVYHSSFGLVTFLQVIEAPSYHRQSWLVPMFWGRLKHPNGRWGDALLSKQVAYDVYTCSTTSYNANIGMYWELTRFI